MANCYLDFREQNQFQKLFSCFHTANLHCLQKEHTFKCCNFVCTIALSNLTSNSIDLIAASSSSDVLCKGMANLLFKVMPTLPDKYMLELVIQTKRLAKRWVLDDDY